MKHFLTILRDSYREAVDGFVIYVMFGLGALLILLIASISFTPEPAKDVVPKLFNSFNLFVPDKGESKYVAAVPGSKFEPSLIIQEGSTVTFRLVVTQEKDIGIMYFNDSFRTAVASWLKKDTRTEKPKLPFLRGGGEDMTMDMGLDILKALNVEVTANEVKEVTDAQMCEYLQNQIYMHLGISKSTVKPVSDPSVKGYSFEVELRNATSSRTWSNEVGLFFGSVRLGKIPAGMGLYIIEEHIINGIGAAITLLISVVVTGFFIPNMLRKGALDLIIAKPIGRIPVLVYKYLGGCLFIFIISGYTIFSVWIIIGIRSGNWDPRLLLTIPMTTFTFALLYAVSTVTAVFTRSAIAAILLTIAFAFGLYVVGKAKQISEVHKNDPDWNPSIHKVIDVVNMVLPRYKDIDNVTSQMTANRYHPPIFEQFQSIAFDSPSWFGTIGLTLLYIVIMLALASWRIVTRDG